jgi:hydrogenase nickel incorporation protein HypB
MVAPIIDKRVHDANPAAKLNRELLVARDVHSVSLVGGPGCGKTTLIDVTAARLSPGVRAGVIACDVASHRDADRLSARIRQVVQVNTDDQGPADATHVCDALRWLDLPSIDLLLIESVGTLVGRAAQDVGQAATVAVLSVAGGDDKAAKHPDLIVAADAVVLSKVDLLSAVPFDLAAFRADVRRLNPRAEFFEVSALRGDGLDRWVAWLRDRAPKARRRGPDLSEWIV